MTEAAKTKTTAQIETATDIQAGLREITERGLDQAKVAYDQFKGQAQEAVELFDGSADALKTGATEFNVKAIEYAQSNINAGFEFARKLLAAKDVKEAVELQSAFTRDQFAAYTAQAKDLSEVTAKLAERTSKPIADGIKKSFDQAKDAFPAV